MQTEARRSGQASRNRGDGEEGPLWLRSALLASAMSVLALPVLAGQAANTLPAGGQVAQGAASIAQSGSRMTINQSTQRAIINWQSFNIGAGAGVTINQPGASSVELERVAGGNLSEIDGSLSSNGQVFLVNPAGILFGAGAQLNVGGLVASTMAITDNAFMSGTYAFSRGTSTGTVTNQGAISASSYVALLAPSLVNEGNITVGRFGSVALAAGDTVTLSTADGLTVAVSPATVATLVANKALIAAPDGTVILTAKALDTLTAQVINSGTIKVSDTIATGNGGTISLLSSGETSVGGALIATGGAQGGNGGSIETSGGTLDLDSATIDAGAPHGRPGSWLLDPYDLTVDAAAAASIDGALAADTSVTLETTASGASGFGTTNPSGNGDIIVASAIGWDTAAALTLSAWRDIAIDAAITHGGPAASLTLTPNTGGGGGSLSFGTGGVVTLGASDNLSIAGNAYTLVTDAAQMQALGLSGYYALANDIDLSAIANFTPIGNASTGFAGTFEGLGHTLANLMISQPAGTYVGLFGDIAPGGAVSDLTLSGVSVTGQLIVGGLAGESWGTIEGVGMSGSISGYEKVGGLVGANLEGLIVASYATGPVSGGSGSVLVGGLTGFNYLATIAASYATGPVSAGSGSLYIGGLVGSNQGRIAASYAAGAVTAGDDSADIGGLSGNNTNASVTTGIVDSYATGAVAAGDGSRAIGGLVGSNYAPITASHATGAVTAGSGSQDLGGLAGENLGPIVASYAGGAVTGGDMSSAVGGLVGENDVAGCSCVNTNTVVASYALGAVTVGTASQGIGGLIGDNQNNTGGLGGTGGTDVTADYASGSVAAGAGSSAVGGAVGSNRGANPGTLTSVYWDVDATGQSAGVGAGSAVGVSPVYSISGSAPSAYSASSYAGFDFANTWYMINGETRPMLRSEYSTTITNAHQLELVNLDLSAVYTLGNGIDMSELSDPSGIWNPANGFVPIGSGATPFAGMLNGSGQTISGLVINEPGTSYVGLFGAIAAGGSVNDVTLGGVSVSGSQYAGALAGFDLGTISGVTVSGGTVSAGLGYSGGLVGEISQGSILSSSFSGTVTGGNTVTTIGGLAGYNVQGTVVDSYAAGTVSVGAGSAFIGGMAGVNAGTISGSYADVAVIAGDDSYAIGGLAGWNATSQLTLRVAHTEDTTIVDSYASGSVLVGDGGQAIGGLVGGNRAPVLASYATGNVVAGANALAIGGFVGDEGGTIIDSYSTGGVTVGVSAAQIGGLVGAGGPGTFLGSYAAGDVTAGDGATAIGGLIGSDYGLNVSGSYATGAVSVGNGSVEAGGLAGFLFSDTSVADSYATGPVSAGSGSLYIGGLVGSNQGRIAASYATGAVTAGDDSADIGGLSGNNTNASVRSGIVDSYATGAVAAGDGSRSVGGLVGESDAPIWAVYAIGSVTVGTASQNIGGLIGEYQAVTMVSAAYAAGSVAAGAGSSAVGGAIGNNAGTAASIYWDVDATGQSAGVGTGSTVGVSPVYSTSGSAPSAYSASSYAGFDFVNTWGIEEGVTRPYLLLAEPLPQPPPPPAQAPAPPFEQSILSRQIAEGVLSALPPSGSSNPVPFTLNFGPGIPSLLPPLAIGGNWINTGGQNNAAQ